MLHQLWDGISELVEVPVISAKKTIWHFRQTRWSKQICPILVISTDDVSPKNRRSTSIHSEPDRPIEVPDISEHLGDLDV
jgi:hypothetical protein